MNTPAISLLKAIINGTTNVKDLMGILGIKEWQFNEHVKKLLQDGFIVKEGNIIKLQENAKTVLLIDIAKKLDLEKFLHGSNELVVSHLTEQLTVSDITRNTGLSTTTVYRAISDLESIGAIKKELNTKDEQTSKIPDRFSIDNSKESLMDYARILKTEREKMYEPDAEIIYKDDTRILKKVSTRKVTEGELTAFSLFSDYGIKYESPYDYYIKQTTPLEIHDVIIHSILAAHKANDKMALIMSIVFYIENKNKTDTLTLRKVSSSYGISEIWLDIEAYLRRKELKNKNLFLPWEEFLSKAKLYDVNPKKYSLPDSTPTLFQDISNNLTRQMKIYLFGGENMRMKNLKASTKDCDVVVETSTDFEALVYVLTEKLGYKPVVQTEFSAEDIRLYPDEILVHPNRSRIDLFTKKIMKDLSLSDRMVDTADFVDYGNLKVGLLGNEYVFLLKAVACREGDIQDMAALAQGGSNQPQEFQHGVFDWEAIWNEIIDQEKINPIRNFTPSIFNQISFLAEQTGIIAPILDKLRRHVIDQLVQNLLRGGKEPLKEIVSLLIGGDISEQMIRNRIDALVKEGTLRKEILNNEIYVTLVNPIIYPYNDQKISPESLETYLKWRFPVRKPSSTLEYEKLYERLSSLDYQTIGAVDKKIIQGQNVLKQYEKEHYQDQPFNRVGAARICISLTDSRVGNGQEFYVSEREKYRTLLGNTLIQTVNDNVVTV